MRRSIHCLGRCCAAVALVGLSFAASFAAQPKVPAKPIAAVQPVVEVELFSGMSSGQLEVQYIHTDQSREAKMIVKNTTKQPLNVRLPVAFGAVPVLAQLGQGGGGGNQGGNQQNQQQQQSGGGGGQGGGGGGMMGGGGMFNVPAEKVVDFKFPTVCLEHGKREPTAHTKYELKPIDEVNSDPRVKVLLYALSTGKVSQRVAQAAAWHFANNLSWEVLAAKKINKLGKADEPYYNPAELRLAFAFAQQVEKYVQETEKSQPAAKSASQASTK